MKYRKLGQPTLTVNVPADRKEIPRGTIRSILRQSKLTQEDFTKVWKYKAVQSTDLDS